MKKEAEIVSRRPVVLNRTEPEFLVSSVQSGKFIKKTSVSGLVIDLFGFQKKKIVNQISNQANRIN